LENVKIDKKIALMRLVDYSNDWILVVIQIMLS